MPFFAFFAAAATAVGTWAASHVVLANFLLSVGLTAIQAALQKKKKQRRPGIDYKRKLGSGADTPRAFIVGRAATGGTLVYHNSWGEASGTPNAYYTRVTAISDLPVDGLHELWVNGRKMTIAFGDPAADGRGYPLVEYTNTFDVDEITTETVAVPGGGTVTVPKLSTLNRATVFGWIKFYDGTQTAADSFLTGNVATAERPWTGKGIGVAYAIVTFRINHNWMPDPVGADITYVVDGITIDNPAGGTIAGDTNPIRIGYHLAKGISYGGRWFYGPQYAPAARLDATEWAADAGPCDDPVPGASSMSDAEKIAAFGSTTIPPRYEFGAEITVDMMPADVMDDARASCNGRFYATAIGYRMQVGDPKASVGSFDDSDLKTDKQQLFRFFPPLAETANAVTATYTEPEEGWSAQDAPGLFDIELEAEDGGRRLVVNLDLPGVFRKEQAQRLQASAAKEERRHKRITRVLPPAYAEYKLGEYLTVSSGDDGFDDKQFRIDGKTDMEDGDVSFSLTEHDPTSYDWDASADYTAPNLGSREDQPVAVIGVPGWTVTAVVIDDGAGTPKRPAILMQWDGKMEDARAIEYQVRHAGNTTLSASDTVSNVEAGGMVVIAQPDTAYEVRAKVRPESKRVTAWTAWTAVTTANVRISESDLDQALNDKIDGAAQDAADAAQDAADAIAAVGGLNQDMIDDLNQIIADFGNIDPNDLIDTINMARAAIRDGWVTDPTFQDWTSGNLTSANWVLRTGVSTYGVQDTANGFYRSSIHVTVPSGSGAVTLVPVLIGADPDAEYLAASIMVDYLAGDPDGARFRVEWSNDGFSTSVRGEMLGQTTPMGTFTQHGLSVKPGILQTKQVLVKRPAGTFSGVRLWVHPKIGTNTAAQEMRIHMIELRPATETEIEAGFVGEMQLDIQTLENEVFSETAGTLRAEVTDLSVTKVDANGAYAAAGSRISAEILPNGVIDTAIGDAIDDEDLPKVRGRIENMETVDLTQDTAFAQRWGIIEAAIGDEVAGTGFYGAIQDIDNVLGDESGGLVGRMTDMEATLKTSQLLNKRADFEDGETGGWGGTVIAVTSAGAWTKALQIAGFNAEGPWRTGDMRGRRVKVRARAQLQNSTADLRVGISFNGASNASIKLADAGAGWDDVEGSFEIPTGASYESTEWRPYVTTGGDTSSPDIRIAWIEFRDITEAYDAQSGVNDILALSVDETSAFGVRMDDLYSEVLDPDGQGTIRARVTTMEGTKVDAEGAVASVETAISADWGSLSAMSEQTATVVSNEGLRASTWILRQKAGAATGTVEAVAYDNPEGSASAITFTYDLIDLQGQVRASDLLVTSQGNNLVPDATLSDPDSWFLPTGWSIKSAPSYVGFARELCYDGPLNQGITSSNTVATFDVHPGREYHAKVQVRSNGAVAHRSQMQVRWFKSDGSPSDFNNDFSGWITETSGSTWIEMDVTAPSDAVAGKLIARVDTNNTGGEVRWSGFDCKEKAGAGELIVDGGIYARHLTVSEAVITDSLQIDNLVIQRGSVQDAQIIGGRSHSAADLIVDMDTSNTDWQFARGYTFTAMTGVGQHGIIGGCRVYVHNFASAAVGVGQIRFRIHVDGSYRAQAPFNVQFTNSTDEVITFPMIPVEVGNGQTIQLRLEYRITNQANNTDGDFDNIDFFAQEHSGK